MPLWTKTDDAAGEPKYLAKQTAIKEGTVSNGALDKITLTENGAGYDPTDPPLVTIADAPSGGITATAEPVVSKGAITSVALTRGSGYEAVFTENFERAGVALTAGQLLTVEEPTGPNGRRAKLRAHLVNGILERVEIVDGGAGYTTDNPAVSVPTPNQNATATVDNFAIGVEGFTITEAGENLNYANPPVVQIEAPTGGRGAEGRAIIRSGSVVGIAIIDPGEGYSTVPTVSFGIAYDGTSDYLAGEEVTEAGNIYRAAKNLDDTNTTPTGMTDTNEWIYLGPVPAATATIGGSLTGITMTDGGYGYSASNPPNVTLTGGTPTVPAKVQAVVNGGIVTGIEMTDGGSGYDSKPTVSIDGVPTALDVETASGTALVSNGEITGIVLDSPGFGYLTAPTVTIAAPTGSVQAVATAVLTGGVVTSIALTNQGAGYTTAPDITLGNAQSGTDHATAVAVVYNGRIESIQVVNGGSGYTSAPSVTIPPPANTTATVTAEVSGGQIVSFTMTNNGAGYVGSPPAVTIPAPAATKTAASITATVKDVYGAITAINLIHHGTGYTAAPAVTITPKTGNTPTTAATATSAISDAVVTEVHGIDVQEAKHHDASDSENITNAVKSPGWVAYTTYRDARGKMRRKVETLVAIKSIESDHDMFGPMASLPSFTTQPADIPFAYGNERVTFEAVANNPAQLPLDFQWHWRMGNTGAFTALLGETALDLSFRSSETQGSNYLFRKDNEFRVLISSTSGAVNIDPYDNAKSYAEGDVISSNGNNYQALGAVSAGAGAPTGTADTASWAYLGTAIKMSTYAELEEVYPYIDIDGQPASRDVSNAMPANPDVNFQIALNDTELAGFTPSFTWQTKASASVQDWSDMPASGTGISYTAYDPNTGVTTLTLASTSSTYYTDGRLFRCRISFDLTNIAAWATGTRYAQRQMVKQGGVPYIAAITHTADDGSGGGSTNEPGTATGANEWDDARVFTNEVTLTTT